MFTSEAIYFPAHVTQGYEEKQRAQANRVHIFLNFFCSKNLLLSKIWKLYVNSYKAAVSDSRYKKDAFDKMQSNKFNVADSEQYKNNEELRKHQSDVQYKVR